MLSCFIVAGGQLPSAPSVAPSDNDVGWALPSASGAANGTWGSPSPGPVAVLALDDEEFGKY